MSILLDTVQALDGQTDVQYGIVEFNVPLYTVYVISETGNDGQTDRMGKTISRCTCIGMLTAIKSGKKQKFPLWISQIHN